MGLRKAIGIMVFATQSVVSADYILQTRDAGLGWGEMSGAQYAAIVQSRFAGQSAGQSAGPLAVAALPRGGQGGAAGTTTGQNTGAKSDKAGRPSTAAEPGICVRRGTALQCN